MALILAIEPDRRQAAQLTSLIRARVDAELVLAETTEQALGAIGDRVPDLVLIPALLAPQDDATLAGALRVIAVAARIQMLTIPVLAATSHRNQPRGVLAKWRRLRAQPAPSGGCDPAVFGDQIAAYLAEAAAERAVNASDRAAAAPAEVSIAAAPMDEVVADILCVFPDLGHAELSVDEPQNEPASAETTSIEDGTRAGGGELWTPPSFEVQRTLPQLVDLVAGPLPEVDGDDSPLVEEPPIVEASIAAGGFTVVEVANEDLTMAFDGISLSAVEDLGNTDLHTGFFLSAFSDEELPVDEPAAYELEIDDLSSDVLAFGKQSIETLQDHPPTIDTVPLNQASQPDLPDLWLSPSFGAQPTWPDLEGMVAEPRQELERDAPRFRDASQLVEQLPMAAPVIAERVAATRFAIEPPLVEDLRMASGATSPATTEDAGDTEVQAEPAVAAATAPAPRTEWLELIESLRRDVERLRTERTRPPAVAAAASSEAPRTPIARPSPSQPPGPVGEIVTKTRKRSGPTNPQEPAKPIQDEWGFFDPERCGFAALLAKLDEITHVNRGA